MYSLPEYRESVINVYVQMTLLLTAYTARQFI
jgi:hypothetical protein